MDDENEEDILQDDELIMFEPPNDCNVIPSDHHPLKYFENLRKCVIPGIDNDGNITSLSDCNGAMILLSLHVASSDDIKCYMYINGECLRFAPGDILKVLPNFFDDGFDDNTRWKTSKEAEGLIAGMESIAM